MFSKDTIEALTKVAMKNGIEPAALLALADVESAGRAFALVGGKREPLIRFEGHYFDRRLPGAARAAARAEGLASPEDGAVANPATQGARWRLLRRAEAIDRRAARESTSWGLGQVMGAHWAWLGYGDVDALVAEARDGVAGQARLMVRYIDKAGLADAVRDHDWRAVARGYNGPAHARNGYAARLARAFRRHAGGDARSPTSTVLRRGMRGTAVRDLQRLLVAHGHPVAVDGAFGPETARAVAAFQRDQGLAVDAVIGPRTRAALAGKAPLARLGAWLWRHVKAAFGPSRA